MFLRQALNPYLAQLGSPRFATAVLVLSLGALGLACAPAVDETALTMMSDADHAATVEEWRQKRDASLRKSDGWLTLVGLYWLEQGESSFGSGTDNAVVFPQGTIAASAGVFERSGNEVTLTPAAGVELTVDDAPVEGPLSLALDTSEEGPTLIKTGTLSFYGIERGELVGIRLKDSANPVLANFEGMNYFDIDPSWHLVGRYELFDEPKVLRTPNVLGTVSEEEIYGAVVFERNGEEYRLEPSGKPENGFFLVFGDQTNGRETYGGGRFLYSEPVAEDGTVVVDFNKAYCPPCVFTPYATCPLPAPQNKLAVRIEAGEKNFGH